MIKLIYGNTNTFFVQGERGGLLVDSDYAGTLPTFYKALKRNDIRISDIEYVKGYDWTGKKVALFATSGGSGLGKTGEKLKPLMVGSPEIIGGEKFSAGASAGELKSWAERITNG